MVKHSNPLKIYENFYSVIQLLKKSRKSVRPERNTSIFTIIITMKVRHIMYHVLQMIPTKIYIVQGIIQNVRNHHNDKGTTYHTELISYNLRST